MILIILGLIVWMGAHLFKRLAPDARAAMGSAGRMLVTVGILAGLALMVIGYQQADGAVFWDRSPMLAGINNLLMVLAVYLFAAAGMKTGIARRIRHPMLTAVKVWALGHLLVNGDTPSFVLFGGLMTWAVIEVIVINRAVPEWTRPEPVAPRKEFVAIVASVVVFGAIAGIHTWLGYPVFG